MKKQTILPFCLLLMVCACHSKKAVKETSSDSVKTSAPKDDAATIQEQTQADSAKGSIKAKAIGQLGTTELKISYYSPAVRGRIIWGGLVPFDKVWVTGAHSATNIEFNHDLVMDGKAIPAGKYAFFTIPTKGAWTLILNKNWRQHLTDQYDEKEDVLRIQVVPVKEDKNQERLRYVVKINSSTEGDLIVYWEKLKISLPFRLK
jgi:hypothetical protein